MEFKTQYNYQPDDVANYETPIGKSMTEIYPDQAFSIRDILLRSKVDPEALRGQDSIWLDADFDDFTLGDFQKMDFAQLNEVQSTLNSDLSKIQALIAEKQAAALAAKETPLDTNLTPE